MTTKVENNIDLDKLELSFDDYKKLQELKKEWTFSSQEVEQILFLRDIFEKNGIYIDDLDKFLNILNSIKLWKNLL